MLTQSLQNGSEHHIEIVKRVSQFSDICKKSTKPLGLVPTMGSLHRGHMALINTSREENRTLAATIFVNPTQFNDDDDFTRYPRDIKTDLSLLEEAGVDIVFTPTLGEMYPPGISTFVDAGPLGDILEGKYRPGHFKGVATIVTKIISISRPTRAYFGQKDAQQCAVIKKINRDLNLGTEIVIVPTIRDNAGLALSSRNVYLSSDEKKAARTLYRSLCLSRTLCGHGENNTEKIKHKMIELIHAEPLASIDYISIANTETLEEIECMTGPSLVSLAVWIGETRLIDNITLCPKTI